VISVVIDEDLDIRLRLHFGPGVRAETVEYRGWKHMKNGILLRAMADAGDVGVFVTADQNLRHQQTLAALPFAVVVLRPRRKRLPYLLELIPEVLRLLPELRSGVVVEVGPPLPA
jgi:hypothetical protein